MAAGVACLAAIGISLADPPSAQAVPDSSGRYEPGPQEGTIRDLGYVPGASAADGAVHQTEEDALEVEAEVVSRDFGISTAEARDRLTAQQSFARWMTEVRQSHGNFSDAVYSFVDKRANVWFAGDVPDGVEPIEAVDVTLQSGAAWTSEEAANISEGIQIPLLREGIEDFELEPNPVTGTILVRVVVERAETVRRLEQRGTFPEQSEGRIEIRTEAPPSVGEDSRGGSRLSTSKTTSSVHCTTGFSALFRGERAQISAGHCAASVPIYYRPTSTSWLGTFTQASHIGAWGDFLAIDILQDLAIPEFYATHTTVRTVSGIAYSANGMNLCNYGRSRDLSTLDCAIVQAWGVTKGAAQRQVVMDEDNAYRGDSGGPWYSLNTAYGIHRGSSCADSCATDSGTSWFSETPYMDNALGEGSFLVS